MRRVPLFLAAVMAGCQSAPPPAPSVETAGPSGLRSVIVSLDKLK